jgi:hypothetical protein
MNSGIIGQTDEYCYVVKDPVHVHDLQAINSALLGYRSHSVDIPVSRPAFPFDRCKRNGCETDSHLGILRNEYQ